MTKTKHQAILLAAGTLFLCGSAHAASVTVANGQTYSTPDTVSGADTVTVAQGGTWDNTASSAAIVWAGGPGSNVVVNNSGAIGSNGSVQPLIRSASGASGTLTINNNNFGTISSYSGGVPISLTGLVPGSNVVINNSGQIINGAGSVTYTGIDPVTHVSTVYVEAPVLGAAINVGPTSFGANFTLNNSGYVYGNVVMGTGVNVVNFTDTQAEVAGRIVGGASATNTINLSGTGEGFAYGQTENLVQAPAGSPPGTPGFPVAQASFYGWDNINALNVNSGSWSLVGAGNYNTVAVASGAAFHVCAAPCGSGWGDSGTPANAGLFSGTMTNAGTVTIDGPTVSTGIYTNSGTTLLHNGATLTTSDGITNTAGTIGGNGTLQGDVTVTGGTVQVGASPDALVIDGNFVQTGGKLVFEVDPNGAGFLESTLVFTPGKTISIQNTDIVFNFVGGADSVAFLNAGDFNLDTFFKSSLGGLFSSAFDLASVFGTDTFGITASGVSIGDLNFNPATGALAEISAGVPEPAVWTMLLLGFGAVGFAMRSRRRDAAPA